QVRRAYLRKGRELAGQVHHVQHMQLGQVLQLTRRNRSPAHTLSTRSRRAACQRHPLAVLELVALRERVGNVEKASARKRHHPSRIYRGWKIQQGTRVCRWGTGRRLAALSNRLQRL